ncbi:MAG TPA: RnfABCDGE type electron transport complex subunit D [Bryobacteraceae bacterium]|nr:RnfABCDGE type electron transport complex subunit D [Bryobacteraceae bacterium]
MLREAKKFFKTPKGLLILILIGLIALAAPGQGWRTLLPGIAAAVAVSGLIDLFILRFRKNVWEFPSGAVLTAMITAMVLRAQEPWYVVTITSAFAVISKYIVRTRHANVFNPAAVAVIASYYVFHTGQSWWGALTEVPLWIQAALILGGIFITDRVKKMPLVLTFLGVYFLLFTAASYLGNPRWVAEIYRSPDAEAALYFAFIILTDPPTSPAKYPDQFIFGTLVAIVSFAFFEWAGVVYYLLAGVLTANIWEAWRRVNRRESRGPLHGLRNFVRALIPPFLWPLPVQNE